MNEYEKFVRFHLRYHTPSEVAIMILEHYNYEDDIDIILQNLIKENGLDIHDVVSDRRASWKILNIKNIEILLRNGLDIHHKFSECNRQTNIMEYINITDLETFQYLLQKGLKPSDDYINELNMFIRPGCNISEQGRNIIIDMLNLIKIGQKL
jgi:hypothetical protein